MRTVAEWYDHVFDTLAPWGQDAPVWMTWDDLKQLVTLSPYEPPLPDWGAPGTTRHSRLFGRPIHLSDQPPGEDWHMSRHDELVAHWRAMNATSQIAT